ncbi:hypothetical protein BXP70_10075 [Hymenobacter crusticola]|uniref:Peptidase S74 domain-containing protein n=2 Tax=Hymenobacter crusticola TaxID=1770526 RepID=A0A243WF15_9BACT|nr:hypothetical protein BXP70_10075 [Hymenobacter crusticola]
MLGTSWAAMAQVPQAMNYQGIARDEAGKLLQSKVISLRISVLAGGAQGAAVYTETHKAFTNAYGSFSLPVGRGQAVKGAFTDINWGSGNQYLQVEMDAAGGTNYKLMGASELLSVPYAFFAGTAARLSGETSAKGGPTIGLQGANGVPSQNWSLFGNSKSDPTTDKLGTTDLADLVIVTNDLERLRITSAGDVNIKTNLNVGNDFRVGRDAAIDRNALIGNDLTVKQNAYFNTVGGSTTSNGPFTVARTSATSLTGTLTVDQATTLKNTLSVNGATTLGSTLGVAGNTTITGNTVINGTTKLQNLAEATNVSSGALVVSGGTGIGGALYVGKSLSVYGNTALTGNLSVAGSSEFVDIVAKNNGTIGNNLTVKNALTVNKNLNVTAPSDASVAPLSVQVGDGSASKFSVGTNGRVTVKSTVDGADNDSNNYPVYVDAARNGMAIKVNSSGQSTNSDKNFIGFFDNGGLRGAVEGQNSADYASDPEFIAELVYQGVKVASLGVAIAATPFEVADIVWITADIAYYAAVQGIRGANIGVSYSSGSGDYAEWLTRLDPKEEINAGDIVGVQGGKITKDTRNAQQLLAVSTAPIVLGNMPKPGQEHLSEKVAFMGQIPVKVRGAVRDGDYIIPSGLYDGVGIAVAPSSMTADEYAKVIGRAWASADGAEEKLVNVVVGLNAGDVAKLLQQEVRERDNLKAMLSQNRALQEKNSQELTQLRKEVGHLQGLASKLSELQQATAKQPTKRRATKLARTKAPAGAVTLVR